MKDKEGKVLLHKMKCQRGGQYNEQLTGIFQREKEILDEDKWELGNDLKQKTLEEITKAIDKVKVGKSPGPMRNYTICVNYYIKG